MLDSETWLWNLESLPKDRSTRSLMGNSITELCDFTNWHETLMRLGWSGFEEWLEANHAEALPKYNDTIRVMYKVRQNICRATHDAAMADESCQMIIDLFLTYLNVLRHEKGELAAFSMAYVEMIYILLGLLRADRECDWPLHLSCIRSMILCPRQNQLCKISSRLLCPNVTFAGN